MGHDFLDIQCIIYPGLLRKTEVTNFIYAISCKNIHFLGCERWSCGHCGSPASRRLRRGSTRFCKYLAILCGFTYCTAYTQYSVSK